MRGSLCAAMKIQYNQKKKEEINNLKKEICTQREEKIHSLRQPSPGSNQSESCWQGSPRCQARTPSSGGERVSCCGGGSLEAKVIGSVFFALGRGDFPPGRELRQTNGGEGIRR